MWSLYWAYCRAAAAGFSGVSLRQPRCHAPFFALAAKNGADPLALPRPSNPLRGLAPGHPGNKTQSSAVEISADDILRTEENLTGIEDARRRRGHILGKP